MADNFDATDRTELLRQYQEVTGISDQDECNRRLEENEWDLHVSIARALVPV